MIETRKGKIEISSEHIGAVDYIEFLARTDLGQQYPKERFRERIEKLVKNTQISLIARNEEKIIVGICFGLTDFAYWLLVTDLGIDRDYVKQGIGRSLMDLSRELAGGKNDIIVFTYANEDAIEFYEKIGMNKSTDMMERTDIEWTPFEVGNE
jgi:GNAT superfamily N-acetyltransferase